MTTETGREPDYRTILKETHQLLTGQFEQLRDSRAREGLPVYALEHDLSPDILSQVCGAVRNCIAAGRVAAVKGDAWLPFLVYSAEVAYGYDGLEYWLGFEEKAPGWNKTSDRDLLAEWYRRFHVEYRGAAPHGRWAAWFKKISWPIANAVLPVYLQRQLAQLLYEDRGMAGLIQEPRALGVRLAGRASGYGTRFRQFCDNTELLGTVAASLLLDRDEPSPYLTQRVLTRIIRSVESERQARIWLGDARAAKKVNARGFVASRRVTGGAPRSARAPKPDLFLRRRDGRWEVCVTLPDLRRLAERLPELAQALESSRPRLLGRVRPLARGRLLDPDQVEALDQWPELNKPLLTLERCSDQVNNMLGDYSLTTRGPWWVFKETGSGTAIEIRGKALRPGGHYVILTTTADKPALSWVEPVEIRTAGVSAFRAVVPEDSMTESEEAALAEVGLSFLVNVIARPVGLVAASWDGQGTVEWIVGEPMMLGINAEKTPAVCLLEVDGQRLSAPWPVDAAELVVDFSGLAVGEHALAVVLQGAEGVVMAQGHLAVVVRDTPTRPDGGTLGEGIRLRIDPSRPTLDELWSRSTTLVVDGPTGAEVQIEVDLRSELGNSLLKQAVCRNATLPVTECSWRRLADSIRKDLADAYDDAESCILSVSKVGLGFAQVNAARPFRRLSWRIRKTRGGRAATVRLVDQTDDGDTKVRYFSPSDPLAPIIWPEQKEIPLEGGLAIGQSGDLRVSVLLPPDPTWFVIEYGRTIRKQHIPAGTRTPARLMELIDAHQMWSSAELPGNLFAETLREDTLKRIDNAICYLITDRDWVHDEARDLLDRWETMTIVTSSDPVFREAAHAIGTRLFEWDNNRDLIMGFNEVAAPLFAKYAHGVRAPAWFTILLADRPGDLSSHAPYMRQWDREETGRLLGTVLAKPLLYKLARMAALGAKEARGIGGAA